jgi:uncharacterized phage protein (TIGR01671 family)
MSWNLKFRIWDKSLQKFVYDDCKYAISLDGKVLENKFWWDENPYDEAQWVDTKDDVVIQLSTGYFDIKGNEIFEGDILKEEWYALNGDYLSDTYVIRFGDYEDGEAFPTLGFYKAYLLDSKSGGNVYPKNDRWKIVGNIFQNADLFNKNE